MPKKSTTKVSKTSVKKREKAEAEAEAIAEAAALAAREASPPGASQAPEYKPELAGSHPPLSSAAETSGAGEETAEKVIPLVTTENQSLLFQSTSADAGSALPPPGDEGINIVGQQGSSEHKDSLSGFANRNSPGSNLQNRTPSSVVGVSSEHRLDSSYSGYRNTNSVVRVLMSMNGHSEGQSKASGASDDVL